MSARRLTISSARRSATATFDTQTIASLGLYPGSHVSTCGSDENAYSSTVEIVPVIASLALMGVA